MLTHCVNKCGENLRSNFLCAHKWTTTANFVVSSKVQDSLRQNCFVYGVLFCVSLYVLMENAVRYVLVREILSTMRCTFTLAGITEYRLTDVRLTVNSPI